MRDNEITRYRVRSGSKQWVDSGPDLLRQRGNARAQLRTIIGPAEQLRHPRFDKGAGWVPVDTKADLLEAFDRWRGREFRVAEVERGNLAVLAVVRRETFPYLILPHSSPGTSLTHSLITHQFDGIKFAGAYVWKQISGTDLWSDHAWGTAVDETHNPPKVRNDEVTDWLARMGRTGNLRFDYLVGSRDGDVVVAGAPDYELEPSRASETHLWHNHVSVIDHDGRKPPRTGGVW